MDLLVVAKAPVPGRVKTRLCPPCTPIEAAALAEAALADTLDAALASRADRVVLALDGEPGAWCPPGLRIVEQGDGDLARRLGAAWRSIDGPALQIGMDTPQVGPADLDAAMAVLSSDGADAVLGAAVDGGWWAVGFRRPRPEAFAGIPTSRPDTGERQRRRLEQMGLRVRSLPVARDVDRWDDALAVAEVAPQGRFARAVRSIHLAAVR